jgi:hypothetical protein
MKKKEIEVRTGTGTLKIMAVVVGPLAAHGQVRWDGVSNRSFSVSHLPSGFAFGGEFLTLKDAVGAARELRKLRDDWEALEPLKVSKKFNDTVKRIYKKFGAFFVPIDTASQWKVVHEKYATDLNGYSPRARV